MAKDPTRTNYVVGFVFCETEVLLIKKERPKWQKGLLNGIGGVIEEGEFPLQAMERKFIEEAGGLIPHSKWEEYCLLKGPGWDVHFFKIFVDSFEGTYDKTNERLKKGQAYLLTCDTVQNLSWLIPMALDKDVITPVTIYSPIKYIDDVKENVWKF